MNGQFSCDKFEDVWRDISLDSLSIDKEFDNTIDVDNDSQFEPETEAEEFVVETVEEDEDNNNDDADHDDDNDDDNDDDDEKKEKKENDKHSGYCDDKEPAPEEQDDAEMR